MEVRDVSFVPYTYFGEQQNPNKYTKDMPYLMEIRFPDSTWSGLHNGPKHLANPRMGLAVSFVAGAGALEYGVRPQCWCFMIDDKFYARVTYRDIPTLRVTPKRGLYRRLKKQLVFYTRQLSISGEKHLELLELLASQNGEIAKILAQPK